jgi:beta-lactamase regulating signal transducer with metallopeptidase domain
VGPIANWLWQGSVVVLVAAAVLRTRRISATTRYRAWWVVLAIVLIVPVASLVTPAPLDRAMPSSLIVATPSTPYAIVLPGRAAWLPSLALAFAVAWVGTHAWRTAAALAALRRAKRGCYPFPETRAIALRGWSARRDDGRRANLVLSNDVSTAAVLGLASPVIAIAPALLRDLSDEELDAIVVHEWAHVQRRDDWARLVQAIVRAVAGLHPAVWWIDRQLHLERETACDDWAIGLTGSPRAYAACLAKVATLRARMPVLTLVPSALTTSDLAVRVVRLLDARRSTSTQPRFAATALVTPLFLATALVVSSVELIAFAAPQFAPPPREPARETAPGREEPGLAKIGANEQRRARPPRRPTPPASAPALETSSKSNRTAIDKSPSVESISTIPAIATHTSTMSAADLPGAAPTPMAKSPEITSAPESPAATGAKEPTPWGAAADAGVGIGRGSQKAAAATAGFFTRLGKSIAKSF